MRRDLLEQDPELSSDKSLTELLIQATDKTGGRPFIFIIDEWDAVIREAANVEAVQKNYLDLLREWFKSALLPKWSQGLI